MDCCYFTTRHATPPPMRRSSQAASLETVEGVSLVLSRSPSRIRATPGFYSPARISENRTSRAGRQVYSQSPGRRYCNIPSALSKSPANRTPAHAAPVVLPRTREEAWTTDRHMTALYRCVVCSGTGIHRERSERAYHEPLSSRTRYLEVLT